MYLITTKAVPGARPIFKKNLWCSPHLFTLVALHDVDGSERDHLQLVGLDLLDVVLQLGLPPLLQLPAGHLLGRHRHLQGSVEHFRNEDLSY